MQSSGTRAAGTGRSPASPARPGAPRPAWSPIVVVVVVGAGPPLAPTPRQITRRRTARESRPEPRAPAAGALGRRGRRFRTGIRRRRIIPPSTSPTTTTATTTIPPPTTAALREPRSPSPVAQARAPDDPRQHRDEQGPEQVARPAHLVILLPVLPAADAHQVREPPRAFLGQRHRVLDAAAAAQHVGVVGVRVPLAYHLRLRQLHRRGQRGRACPAERTVLVQSCKLRFLFVCFALEN